MFLLRHGQSFFNLHYTETRTDPGIADPELTPLGHQQAEDAAMLLERESITQVIVSPYTRALQTAAAVLARRRVPVTVMHEVRERAAFSCDIGSAPERLAARFPHHEFGHLPAVWWPGHRETTEETVARADMFRGVMAGRADSATTLLVSHWGFLLALSGVSLSNGEVLAYDPRQAVGAPLCWKP